MCSINHRRYQICLLISLISIAVSVAAGQANYCKAPVFWAMKEIPKLEYECSDNPNDSDDAVLKAPERLRAIRKYEQALEAFNSQSWWASSVDDLTYCDVHKKIGRLTKEEVKSMKDAEYFYKLYGNQQIRVVHIQDPCYQTGYNGSNMFLLYRLAQKVYVTEIVDGFFTRADFPIGVDFATLEGQKLIEIATTTGGLYPMVINYYFAIDSRTNRAVPKKLFRDEKGKPTHIISSMMLLGEPEEYGLPKKTEPLVIFKNGQMKRSFVVLDDSGRQRADDHQVFEKTTLRWNGKYFH